MGDIAQLRAALDEARTDLLAAFEGIHHEVFVRPDEPGPGSPSVRDMVWNAGLFEDWTRRVVQQGVEGREPPPYTPRERPAMAETPGYLVEWLEQCRRPLLALLRRLPEDALDRAFTLTGGESTTARRMLQQLVEHDRAHAARIRALRDAGEQ